MLFGADLLLRCRLSHTCIVSISMTNAKFGVQPRHELQRRRVDNSLLVTAIAAAALVASYAAFICRLFGYSLYSTRVYGIRLADDTVLVSAIGQVEHVQ